MKTAYTAVQGEGLQRPPTVATANAGSPLKLFGILHNLISGTTPTTDVLNLSTNLVELNLVVNDAKPYLAVHAVYSRSVSPTGTRTAVLNI
eukprot:SAG31_NODE_1199_length_9431_cov_18.273789_8_plen_91_part_00